MKIDEDRGGCCQLGREEEGNLACLVLQDAKIRGDDKPIVLRSDLACLLSSIQK